MGCSASKPSTEPGSAVPKSPPSQDAKSSAKRDEVGSGVAVTVAQFSPSPVKGKVKASGASFETDDAIPPPPPPLPADSTGELQVQSSVPMIRSQLLSIEAREAGQKAGATLALHGSGSRTPSPTLSPSRSRARTPNESPSAAGAGGVRDSVMSNGDESIDWSHYIPIPQEQLPTPEPLPTQTVLRIELNKAAHLTTDTTSLYVQ